MYSTSTKETAARQACCAALCLMALLLLTACCGRKAEEMEKGGTRVEFILKQMNDPDSRYVLVAAHRGDWRNYPENSLPAIESVIAMGADIMELDLKMTRDSILVLCHDKTLDRTTNGSGPVSNLTLAQIKELKLKRAHGVVTDDVRMPTLREALEVCKDRIVVNVDKGYEYYDLVLALTEELGVTGQVLIKGKMPVDTVAHKMAAHPRNMMYMPIIDIHKPQGKQLLEAYKAAGEVPVAYELCWDRMTDPVRDAADFIVQSGSKLWVNTLWASLCGGLDDDRAYAEGTAVYDSILTLGTSLIQTDRPEFLIAYLKQNGRH